MDASDDAVVTVAPTLPRRTAAAAEHLVGANPYLHFMLSEAWGALAGVGVYAIFHLAAVMTDGVTERWPLHDPAPAQFFTAVLHWGGALGGSATFIVITVYQLIVLIKRLWSEVAS